MRILAIDPAMANIGIWCGDLLDGDPERLVSQCPSWQSDKGSQCYSLLHEIARGTLTTSPTEPMWNRIQECTDFIHGSIEVYRPNILISEAVLTHGPSRNVTGGMVLASILDRYRELPRKNECSFLEAVLTIPPSKLRSVAHQASKKTKGQKITKAIVKQRYRDVRLLPKKTRLTDHEADAFFLAYHGIRFWMTCVTNQWSKNILTPAEVRAYITGTGKNPRTKIEHSTALIKSEGDQWWWRKLTTTATPTDDSGDSRGSKSTGLNDSEKVG